MSDDLAAAVLLPAWEARVLDAQFAQEETHLPIREEECCGRHSAPQLLAGCALVASLVAAACLWGARASPGHFLASPPRSGLGRGSDLPTTGLVGALASGAGVLGGERRPARRVPVRDLVRRLRHTARWLYGSGESTSKVLKDLRDAYEVAKLNATTIAGFGGLASLGRRLVPNPLPGVLIEGSFAGNRINATEEEKAILYTYCALNAENVVASLGYLGLALDGVAKTCVANAPDFDKLACAGFVTAFLSWAGWAAASASTMPETCGLVDLKDADCVAESSIFFANVFQQAVDGIAVQIDCFEGRRLGADSGGRRGPRPSPAAGADGPAAKLRRRADRADGPAVPADPAEPATALEALGLAGRQRRRAGRRRGRGRPSVDDRGAARAQLPVTQTHVTAFTRGADVGVCYFTAENTASTVIDAGLAVFTAVQACQHFIEHRHVEDQEICAAEISNFLSDISTVAANAAYMATVCPVVAPSNTVPCAGDWVDTVATLANWAIWGASFAPDCLRKNQSQDNHTM